MPTGPFGIIVRYFLVNEPAVQFAVRLQQEIVNATINN
jgi:hypothetical protein